MVNGLFSLLHGVVVVVAIGAAVTPVTTTTSQSTAAISQPPPSSNNLEPSGVQVTYSGESNSFRVSLCSSCLVLFLPLHFSLHGALISTIALRATYCFTAMFWLGQLVR